MFVQRLPNAAVPYRSRQGLFMCATNTCAHAAVLQSDGCIPKQCPVIFTRHPSMHSAQHIVGYSLGCLSQCCCAGVPAQHTRKRMERSACLARSAAATDASPTHVRPPTAASAHMQQQSTFEQCALLGNRIRHMLSLLCATVQTTHGTVRSLNTPRHHAV